MVISRYINYFHLKREAIPKTKAYFDGVMLDVEDTGYFCNITLGEETIGIKI